ncbi:hypothetical protein [Bacillus sp. SN10]|uniref:hypothetical protein n=1 Tax=Bacillus sp. SN10 TaxID=2056493 RepID=UPI000C31EC6F|nr:hypothetical protein [Bacillus sp. SN10]PKJ54019.1 hypothetical protein CWE34_18360 [Bacillus sp. SN10]
MGYIDQLIGNYGYAAVFSGSLIGRLVSYEIGKRIGRPLLTWLGKWLRSSLKWSNKAEGWIQK